MTEDRGFEVVLNRRFLEDLEWWIRTDRRMALRLVVLVQASAREPFTGIGKPEALRHDLAGTWSRRIDKEHRLVYEVVGERIYFLQGRYHY